MGKKHDLLQRPSRADVWQTIPKPGKMLGVTGVSMSVLFKIYPHLQERKISWDWMCFLVT